MSTSPAKPFPASALIHSADEAGGEVVYSSDGLEPLPVPPAPTPTERFHDEQDDLFILTHDEPLVNMDQAVHLFHGGYQNKSPEERLLQVERELSDLSKQRQSDDLLQQQVTQLGKRLEQQLQLLKTSNKLTTCGQADGDAAVTSQDGTSSDNVVTQDLEQVMRRLERAIGTMSLASSTNSAGTNASGNAVTRSKGLLERVATLEHVLDQLNEQTLDHATRQAKIIRSDLVAASKARSKLMPLMSNTMSSSSSGPLKSGTGASNYFQDDAKTLSVLYNTMTELQDVRKHLPALTQRLQVLASLHADASTFSGRLTAVENGMRTLSTQVASIQNSVEMLQSNWNESAQANMRANLQALDERLTELRNTEKREERSTMVLKKSIIDYALDSDDVLLRDLLLDELYAAKLAQIEVNPPKKENDHEAAIPSPTLLAHGIEDIGWIVSNCDDANVTEALTAQDEFDRLQVLKKYSSMSITGDETLNKLTSMACDLFQHDYTWILLMDLRKSWIVAEEGFGGLAECPRSQYFPCAHALHSTTGTLMVENLLEDPRFVKSPFAIGPLGARFYAAAPLISPQGFRIGVFGVASKRPSTMSRQDQGLLSGFADLAMRHLVDRRRKLDLEENLKRAVACTSHDIMTPLMGLQLSLSLLKEDDDLDKILDDDQREALATADNCVSTMCQLGKSAMQDLAELVDRLHLTLDPVEKSVPLMISIDPDAPSTVMVADLKVFRAAVALLCLACSRTTSGCIILQISMNDNKLMFACETSAPALLDSETEYFVNANASTKSTLPCLRLVATAVRSLGGTCGQTLNDNDRKSTTLWFKLPHAGPEIVGKRRDEGAVHETVSSIGNLAETIDVNSNALPVCTARPNKRPNSDVTTTRPALDPSLPRKKKALVVDDSLVVRKTMERALSTKFGYDVIMAEDGKEGLDRLQEQVFDVVFMDFLMPVMDGWDCTQQYRMWEAEHRPWFRQLIIGMSAHAGDDDVHRANQFGMDDYRCKPVTIKTLTDLCEDLKLIQVQKQLDCLLPLFSKTNHGTVDVAESIPKRLKGSLLCLSSEITISPRARSPHVDSTPLQLKPRVDRIIVGLPTCLVACSAKSGTIWSTPSTAYSFQQRGWNVELVESSDDALACLKQRNYDAVIVENELAPLSGVSCISKFREWETGNRVNRQKNVLLQFPAGGALMSRGSTTIVQPPCGFDGVIGTGALWDDFDTLVKSDLPRDNAQVSGIVLR
ncbi:hypothetical protein MPSEU_000934800 [Mayamaea pseudoterrestris]|nr:hypothetical protein MPSEU_000934800 [Mayamaea pseudoterrestris]